MMAEQQADLRGELQHMEPMSKHTSWRVGGPADCYYRPADVDDLALFLERLPADEPLTWVGLGSNILVRDGGIRGTVIATSGLLNELSLLADEKTLRAEAGVSCAKIARFAARHNLTGAEFLAGIPGTMGGALAMNAGAFGGETWGLVGKVETLHRSGQRHVRRPDDYKVGYRSVQGPADEWFIAVYINLLPGNVESGQARIKELLARRGQTQPTSQPSCGSVFRNPEGDHAARLIEECGLKGKCIGGACVSDKHANFIINTGTASAMDIELLINEVAQTVKQNCDVELRPEVRIIGEAEIQA